MAARDAREELSSEDMGEGEQAGDEDMFSATMSYQDTASGADRPEELPIFDPTASSSNQREPTRNSGQNGPSARGSNRHVEEPPDSGTASSSGLQRTDDHRDSGQNRLIVKGTKKDTRRSKVGSRSAGSKNNVDKEIRRLGNSVKPCTPTAAFARIMKELVAQFQEGDTPYRFTVEALCLFQSASEDYLTSLFGDSYLCTVHRKRITLQQEDIRLVRRLRAPYCWKHFSA